ncbi:T-cell surface antigen CD2 [Molossus molossus]|uniref:T-cell surface antigen CD2 n=1 Tax=Molossus molossus TaxID=27622 RepID=A0A7J8CPU9_MOLMO|nr:T-cell surface antigen CD2 [Molossus molossus]KAF6412887.1 CD2 molecule [Molossus molossus]
MSFACKILASFLLIFIFSIKGAASTTISGVLHHAVNLDIHDLKMNDNIDDIQWKKEKTWIARFNKGKIDVFKKEKEYQLFNNGTLKIKKLQRNNSGDYNVYVYDRDGKEVLNKRFNLKILEKVSKPVISWGCTNLTITCEITQGTDPKLTLYENGKNIKEGQKVIVHKWTTKPTVSFKCTATNTFSEETSMADVRCSEDGLDIYTIIGISGGGLLFLLIVGLLILFISKRKKQHRRTHGEELDIRAHRITSQERSQTPHQIPASGPQNPAMSQLPPPSGHRPQAHGHRPPPPGHRVQHQHQQQKRPLPSPGTRVHQQKGPPLPRPRVQPKPPRGATENS